MTQTVSENRTLVVETQGLTKQFDSHIAVDSVSLKIYSGDVYGLIGPNGAGKTTLIRLLATAEEPTVGDIFIGGLQLKRGQPNTQIKRQLGLLPDDFPLYEDLTVDGYLDYFGRLYNLEGNVLQQRITEVLELVTLDNKRHAMINTLSRGMRQRLSLARTVLHQPTLLLLDEPVSGLDPIARIEYRQTIKALQKQGITILISSHILSDLEDFCTAIGIMEQGRLVESGQLQTLYQPETQQIAISVVDNVEGLKQYFCDRNITVQPIDHHSLEIQFTGDQQAAANLLHQLITAGFTISEFHRIQETLEDIFIRSGYQRTA
ncbi:MAG: ABC transporter ATP-binding protein [Cyanobacteria bacterium P01_F01_bin.116]